MALALHQHQHQHQHQHLLLLLVQEVVSLALAKFVHVWHHKILAKAMANVSYLVKVVWCTNIVAVLIASVARHLPLAQVLVQTNVHSHHHLLVHRVNQHVAALQVAGHVGIL